MGQVTSAPGAKTEVVADQEPLHRQTVAKNMCDEVVGRQLRERVVEAAHVHARYSTMTQQFEFLAQRGQARGCLVRGEKFLRLRLEGHHCGQQAARPRRLGEPRDHGAMPEMDAVEIADGERDGRVRPRRDTPKDPHTRSVKSLNFSGFCTPGARFS